MIDLKIIPVTLKEANNYVELHHRHHKKVQGCKFCIGVVDELYILRGVAIVGRPVSRYLDTGLTAEVTRLCTDGMPNACSFLYSACARIAKQMGYTRIQTYILESEVGTSCLASSWALGKVCGGGNWNVKSRPRKDSLIIEKKKLYYKALE